MSCQTASRLISRLLDGELGPAEERALRQHLAHCPHCEALWLRMRQVQDVLGAERGWAIPPADFTARVMARVQVTPRPRHVWRTLLGATLTVLGGMAVVLSVVIALLPELLDLGEWAQSLPYPSLDVQPLLGMLASLRDAAWLVSTRLLATAGVWAALTALVLVGMFVGLVAVWSRVVSRLWSAPSGSGAI